MNLHQRNHLIDITLKSPEEHEMLFHAGLLEFLNTVQGLEKAGLSQSQLQWLLGRPFSRFKDEDFFTTQLLALSLLRGTARVDDWHRMLQEEGLRARMNKCDPWFPAEQMPQLEDINAELGLTANLAIESGATAAGDGDRACKTL
jgi:hypothetical protein